MKMKKFLSMAMVVSMLFGASLTTYADEISTQSSQNFELQDIELSSDKLADGVSVVMNIDDNGNVSQQVYCGDFESQREVKATADGVLEWAIFHLGFNDWNEDTGRLYFTIEADEPITYVVGNAYVKSTSLISSIYYYNDVINDNMYKQFKGTRVVCENVDTGSADKVRVGFSNLSFGTIASYGSFANDSVVVNRP